MKLQNFLEVDREISFLTWLSEKKLVSQSTWFPQLSVSNFQVLTPHFRVFHPFHSFPPPPKKKGEILALAGLFFLSPHGASRFYGHGGFRVLGSSRGFDRWEAERKNGVEKIRANLGAARTNRMELPTIHIIRRWGETWHAFSQLDMFDSQRWVGYNGIVDMNSRPKGIGTTEVPNPSLWMICSPQQKCCNALPGAEVRRQSLTESETSKQSNNPQDTEAVHVFISWFKRIYLLNCNI